MEMKRTDLALEAKELWEESAEKETKLSGVIAKEREEGGFRTIFVEIVDKEGEEALGKPKGRYVTIEHPRLGEKERGELIHGAELLARELRGMVKLAPKETVLVCGLGNRHMTADAVGPLSMEWVLVTRHLISTSPEYFGEFRGVSALATGVLGDTGIESGEIIQGVVEKMKPDCLIVVDALASRSVHRLYASIQISDTGIIPGSGVGNHRMALNKETMGIPVIALGVPTVVDGMTLCLDLLEKAGQGGEAVEKALHFAKDMFVTPREVDAYTKSLSKVLGMGISLALHESLGLEEVEMFLS